MTYKNASRPRLHPIKGEDDTLKVTVVFTSDQDTLSALEKAAVLAGSMPARITLLYPQIVPYPRQVNDPPVSAEFTERRLRLLASQVPVDSTIQVCLCRDREDALTASLTPRSLVVLGGRKTWWPTAEKNLARKLRRAGHEVIFTETE